MTPPILYSDAIETVPADEEQDGARLLETLEMLLRFHVEWSGRREREVHVKSHGSVRGEFHIATDLPPELAQGLFARPRAYPAWVRFSNASPWPQPDILPDGRGLAIQLAGVEGETLGRPGLQDFIMVNSPTFLSRDVKDYLRLLQDRLRAGRNFLRLGARLLSHFGQPANWGGLGAALRIAAQIPSHPAAYTYWSMVPFRFGRFVAKYRVRPARQNLGTIPGMAATFLTDPNAMRRLLSRSLARGELVFEFQVQLRTSETSMPIEDATVEWPERESPYRTVATLRLPPQALSAVPDDSVEERRSFTVWNALADHRPLGGINRSRRLAYAASARFRNES